MGSGLSTAIALVSSTDMNQYLGITVTTAGTSTEELESDYFNNAASQFALGWSMRSTLVLSSALTEYYQGNDSTYIETLSYPITGVTQLWVDPSGVFASGGTVFATADYQIDEDNGRIFLLSGIFSCGFGRAKSIKLTYSAGYSTIPYDLQQAVKELVQFWYQRSTDKRVGVQSQTAGNTTKSYESDIPKSVKAVLDAYRNKAAMIG
jgi:hypothetical protein